eukprot:365803-Chlamydomonas_euryale.AAC.4
MPPGRRAAQPAGGRAAVRRASDCKHMCSCAGGGCRSGGHGSAAAQQQQQQQQQQRAAAGIPEGAFLLARSHMG